MAIDLAHNAANPAVIGTPPAYVVQVSESEMRTHNGARFYMAEGTPTGTIVLAAIAPQASAEAGDSNKAPADKSFDDVLSSAAREGLKSSDFDTRYNAVEHFITKGTAADKRELVPVILEMYKDRRAYEGRNNGENKMGMFIEWSLDQADDAQRANAAKTFLADLQSDSLEPNVQLLAIRGLARIKEAARPALPEIQKFLAEKWNEGDGKAVSYGMRVVMNLDKDKAVELAAKGLEHPKEPVKNASLEIIAKHGQPAMTSKFMLKVHQQYKTDSSWEIRWQAGRALIALAGREKAFALFKGDLASTDNQTKGTAIRLMGQFGKDGLPFVTKHLNDANLQWCGLLGICDLGPVAKPLLPQVQAFRKDGHPQVRMYAEWAYSRITGPEKAK